MVLSTDTVDGNTTVHETFDQGNEIVDLGTGIVQVVVVKAQLGSWISSTGSLEGNVDKLLSEETVEDGVTEDTAILENFIDDVPMQDFPLVPCHDGSDVVLDDRGQGSSAGDVGNPPWQLTVPDQGVASDLLTVGGSVVDQIVGTGQGEAALGRLCRIPLHGVLRGYTTELSLNDSINLADTKSVLINSSSKV